MKWQRNLKGHSLLCQIIRNEVWEVENSKKIDNDCQQGMVFGEKELHCLSRTLQAFQLEAEHVVEGEMQCMYCKYSFECRDEFFKRHKAPYMTLLKKLERITGVDVYLSEETMHRDILSRLLDRGTSRFEGIFFRHVFKRANEQTRKPGYSKV